MTINYHIEAEKYRPSVIKTLLVGEAPPPSCKAYFYLPRLMTETTPIERDASLPATIFHHYFRTRPNSIDAYTCLLRALKANGIFLIDICDDPIRVRGSKDGLSRIVSEIPRLRSKLAHRGISVADESIVFLLARRNYKRAIRDEFPNAKLIEWRHFRNDPITPPLEPD
jgi:hypothetical protein